MTQLLDDAGLAKFLGIKETWPKENRKSRTPASERIPYIRISRKVVRYRMEDVERFLAERAGDGEQPKKNLRVIGKAKAL
jgi:hypothetical protein